VTSQVAPASAAAPTSAPGGAEPQGDLDRAGSTGAAAPARSTPPTTGTAASTGAAATAADATPVSPAGAPTGTGGQVGRVQAAWAAILDRLARDSKVAWTLFHSAFPISLTGSVLAVAVPEPGMVRNIAQRGHDERLRQAIIDVLGIDVSVDVVHDPDASRGPGSPEGPGAGLPDTAPAAGPAAGSGPTSEAGEPPVPAPDHREAGRRGRDLVRAATAAVPEQEPADEPSEDDPDLEAPGHDGLALITRELGARPIGEIDHS
jgi:DNA polymerase-3 subunit gamma/tau